MTDSVGNVLISNLSQQYPLLFDDQMHFELKLIIFSLALNYILS